MGRLFAFVLFASWIGWTQAAPPFAQWREWPPAPQWSEGTRAIERASFAALDRNRDFMLSREEAAASPPVAFNFTNADLDRDGRLSPLEFNNIALALG